MGKHKNRMPSTAEEAQDTLGRFVVRARRIKEHSMVKSGEVNDFAEPSFTLEIGQTTVSAPHHNLPENQEIVESLAARLRPYIVESEPIHLSKVFHSIKLLLDDSNLAEKQISDIDGSVQWFEHHVVKQDAISYISQTFDAEGNPLIPDLSDLQIAQGWMYADLVHADPYDDKANALNLPYEDRYYAATSFFSALAIEVIKLLKIVSELNNQYGLGIPEDAWQQPVISTGTAPAALPTKMYVGPVGTVVPYGARLEDIPELREATPTLMKYLTQPDSRATVAILGKDGIEVARYIGVYSLIEDKVKVVIEDALEIELSIDLTVFESFKKLQCKTFNSFRLIEGHENVGRQMLKMMQDQEITIIAMVWQNKPFGIGLKLRLNEIAPPA